MLYHFEKPISTVMLEMWANPFVLGVEGWKSFFCIKINAFCEKVLVLLTALAVIVLVRAIL